MAFFESSPFVSMEEINRAFEKFNATEEGLIPYKLLKTVMRDLGLDPREAEVAKFVESLRAKQDKKYCQTHFSASALFELLNDRKKNSNVDEIRTAFQLFDVKAKGYIDVDDLKLVTQELREEVGQEELQEMLECISTATTGHVSFAEFAVIMKKTSLY